jgi:CDP-glucose 4,6-dehydratase
MLVTKEFWSGRRVFITGQTGFKGAWLAFWLAELGAEVFRRCPAAQHNAEIA